MVQYTQIFFHDFQEVFRRKYSLNPFSQDNAVRTYEKVNAILYSCCHVDLDYNVAGASHSRYHSFFLWQAGRKVDVISSHSLKALLLDEGPKFGECAVNYDRVSFWIVYFGEQIFSFNDVHGMALGGPDEDMMFPFLYFESFLIIGVDYFSDVILVNVFVSFSPEILHELLKRNVATRVDGQSFLDCSVSQYPGHCFGKTSIFVLMPSILTPTLHVELQFFV